MNRRRLLGSAVAFCLPVLTASAAIDGSPKADDRPDLGPFLAEVRRLVERHYPKATVRRDGSVIHFEFNTRKFLIHEPLLTGEWQDAHEEVGPQKGGIYADLSLNPGKYQGMADVPQSFDKRYFTLRVMAPYSGRLDRHLSVHLKYPRDVPPGFLPEFQRLVNEFDEARPGEKQVGTGLPMDSFRPVTALPPTTSPTPDGVPGAMCSSASPNEGGQLGSSGDLRKRGQGSRTEGQSESDGQTTGP